MKKILILVGVVAVLLGCIRGGQYFIHYNALSEYGKGFVAGNLILITVGAVLIYLGIKRKRI